MHEMHKEKLEDSSSRVGLLQRFYNIVSLMSKLSNTITVLDRNLLGLFCNKQSGCVLCVGSDFSPYKCVTVVIMPTTDSVYYYQWTY